MEQKYTREEYRKLVNKGKRFLTEYLVECFHDDKRDLDEERELRFKKLCKVMGDEYVRLMKEDESFFRNVEAFCKERRKKSEKQEFFRGMVSVMVKSGNIHRKYAYYDSDFEVPERHRM